MRHQPVFQGEAMPGFIMGNELPSSLAMSTPVGHSGGTSPCQSTTSRVSCISLAGHASAPRCPDSASRSALARPRVDIFSSRVTR